MATLIVSREVGLWIRREGRPNGLIATCPHDGQRYFEVRPALMVHDELMTHLGISLIMTSERLGIALGAMGAFHL